jgi:hypothetical protein
LLHRKRLCLCLYLHLHACHLHLLRYRDVRLRLCMHLLGSKHAAATGRPNSPAQQSQDTASTIESLAL